MESVDMQLLKSCDLQGRRGATPRGATKFKNMTEKEKLLKCYEKGYRIDKEGTICYKNNTRKGCIQYCNKIPYLKISIKIGNKTCNVPVHRLQAYQKYGNKLFENGMEVRHLNGNSLDNSYDNIAIGTHSENMFDKPKEVRLKQANIATSYMKKHNHEEIYDYYIKCKSYKETMKKFNISSKGTLHFILEKFK